MNAYTAGGNLLSNFVVKNAAGTVVATESSRSGANNEFVKFNSFTANTKVNAGTTSTYTVEAAVGQLNGNSDAGEFRVKIATAFTDSAYAGQIYSGMRLYSVAAGNYVTAGTVTTSAIGNSLSIVSAHPLATFVANGNSTDLLTFKVTNKGAATLNLSGVDYFASAQSGGDLAGKAFSVFNGSTVVATGTLAV